MSANVPEKTNQLTEEQKNRELLRAAVKLNTWLLAVVFAFVIGFSLFVLTLLSLARGLPRPGQYLNLLGVFLPGYEVSLAGAWVGLFWGALLGGLCAVLFYRVYARGIEKQVQGLLDPATKAQSLTAAVLFLNGKFLGMALGSIVAGGLIVSTNWLVLRGTAHESVHAKLLVNYLPGYSIDLVGSLIGALELFFLCYFIGWLFSWIYNRLASLRQQKPQ